VNAYVAISEDNKRYSWYPSPNEQFEQPPVDAVCWVNGDSDEDLLASARSKFSTLGFEIIEALFYSPGPGGRAIHLIVKERIDTDDIEIGTSHLTRTDLNQKWYIH
jgi:hypothetical protein